MNSTAKKLIICLFLGSLVGTSFGQEKLPKRVTERSKDQANNRIESRSEQGVEGAMNKIEEGIGSLFRRKNKNIDQSEDLSGGNDEEEYDWSDNDAQAQKPTPQTRRKVNSKFDFVSGEKVIAYDDFETVDVGDFPVYWNTNSSGQIVSFDDSDQKWFYLSNSGIYVPDYVNTLPENFTVEFEITVSDEFSNNMTGFRTIFVQKMEDRMNYDFHFNDDPQVTVDIHPLPDGIQYSYYAKTGTGAELNNQGSNYDGQLKIYRISMWRQGTRIRVYVDDEKVFDIPRAFSPDIEYALLFGTNYWAGQLFVSDLKIAVGQPDTRSKLITDGKFVTNSITFDSGSDVLKNSSFGVLKEIAETLKQNPGVKVQIIGHTDSDGSEALNLDLSKRRAAAVKRTLVSDFGIDASRMETDGKGQSQPIAPNNTSEGKAQNRRVEFIKL